MKKFRFDLVIVFLFFLILPRDLRAADSDGKVLYEKSKCTICHGVDGKGVQKIADSLKIDRSKLDLTDKETTDKKDTELERVINDGAGKMKGYKSKFNVGEIPLVVAHIRTLQKAVE